MSFIWGLLGSFLGMVLGIIVGVGVVLRLCEQGFPNGLPR